MIPEKNTLAKIFGFPSKNPSFTFIRFKIKLIRKLKRMFVSRK